MFCVKIFVIFVTLFAFGSLEPRKYLIETENKSGNNRANAGPGQYNKSGNKSLPPPRLPPPAGPRRSNKSLGPPQPSASAGSRNKSIKPPSANRSLKKESGEKKLGKFSELSYGVSGEVFSVGDSSFKIKNFNYDGKAPEGPFFVVGTAGSGPKDRIDAGDEASMKILCPTSGKSYDYDKSGSVPNLKKAENKEHTLNLKPGAAKDLKISDLKWIAVWCVQYKELMGSLPLSDSSEGESAKAAAPPAEGGTKAEKKSSEGGNIAPVEPEENYDYDEEYDENEDYSAEYGDPK